MRHFACAAILVLLPSLALAQEKTIATRLHHSGKASRRSRSQSPTVWPGLRSTERRDFWRGIRRSVRLCLSAPPFASILRFTWWTAPAWTAAVACAPGSVRRVVCASFDRPSRSGTRSCFSTIRQEASCDPVSLPTLTTEKSRWRRSRNPAMHMFGRSRNGSRSDSAERNGKDRSYVMRRRRIRRRSAGLKLTSMQACPAL